MITAVDTNVLLDVLVPGAPHSEQSERALVSAARSGAVIISEPVYAELSAHFKAQEQVDRLLADTGIALAPSSAQALYRAGEGWSKYVRHRPAKLVCPQCGANKDARCAQCGGSIQPRQHVVADFLIGAHALIHAYQLLTRDRGYYFTYFPDLPLG